MLIFRFREEASCIKNDVERASTSYTDNTDLQPCSQARDYVNCHRAWYLKSCDQPKSLCASKDGYVSVHIAGGLISAVGLQQHRLDVKKATRRVDLLPSLVQQ